HRRELRRQSARNGVAAAAIACGANPSSSSSRSIDAQTKSWEEITKLWMREKREKNKFSMTTVVMEATPPLESSSSSSSSSCYIEKSSRGYGCWHGYSTLPERILTHQPTTER